MVFNEGYKLKKFAVLLVCISLEHAQNEKKMDKFS